LSRHYLLCAMLLGLPTRVVGATSTALL
jgi:hypothetical protein